jgi:hypothetical protein
MAPAVPAAAQTLLNHTSSVAVGSDQLDFEVVRVAALLESDPTAATRQAAHLLRLHPDHPAALLLLGSAHRRAGDAAAAVADFTPLAASRPGSAVLRLELGRALHAASAVAATVLAKKRPAGITLPISATPGVGWAPPVQENEWKIGREVPLSAIQCIELAPS